MMNKRHCLFLMCIFAIVSPSGWALTASVQSAVSNDFIFIENNVDNEYFITPSSLDPRITGANTWVRYRKDQDSLGYIGIVGWTANTSYYKDMWIDNSPIHEPFRGIRCTTGSDCPATGYISATQVDQYGFYHTKATGSGISGGHYAFASLTESAYDYLRNMTVGSSETYNLNFCRTKIDYNYSAGQRCKDQSSGDWYKRPFTLNKVGHLSLVSTNAFQELWVASDGTPSMSKDSGYCEIGVVKREDGVICKMVYYKFNQSADLTKKLKIKMYADSDMLLFKPASSTIKYSGDGQNWSDFGSESVYSGVFSGTGQYVYVFLSKKFLKKMVDNGVSITNTQPFTFAFVNDVTPESGYYQFTPSLKINILPKEYGISIISSNNTSAASGSGTVGDINPIEMDYTVTVSGPRQADTITAQVIGESTRIDNVPYCLFTSADETLSVPFPALLQYNDRSGRSVQKSNSCGESAINMSDALWQQTPWDMHSTDDGSYFTTSLKLVFPMNNPRSALTVSGHDWEGIVSASGEIKVTANWVGVTP